MAKSKRFDVQKGQPTAVAMAPGSSDHISQDVADYAGMTRDEITDFLATKDYEVHAVFTADGELVHIVTQYQPDRVDPAGSIAAINDHIKNNPGKKHEFEDFHNHPMASDGTFPLFSGDDMRGYSVYADYKSRGAKNAPTKYAVKTAEGHSYELEYVGGGKRKPKNFARQYSKELRSLERLADTKNYIGDFSSQKEYVTFINDEASAWLESNAGLYGFKYTAKK